MSDTFLIARPKRKLLRKANPCRGCLLPAIEKTKSWQWERHIISREKCAKSRRVTAVEIQIDDRFIAPVLEEREAQCTNHSCDPNRYARRDYIRGNA
jgi:hypothetical protein